MTYFSAYDLAIQIETAEHHHERGAPHDKTLCGICRRYKQYELALATERAKTERRKFR